MSCRNHTCLLLGSLLLLFSTLTTSCHGGPEERSGFKKFIPYLDRHLKENSGLIWYRGKLWTINDSGGEAEIYAVEAAGGSIVQTVRLRDTRNRDWEELAQDADYLYAFDIGNNYGRRKKLSIYRISKALIPDRGDISLRPERITYRYIDQPDERLTGTRSAFDAEAAFVLHDSLWLLTKNWHRHTSTLYACPLQPGEYVLEPRMEIPVGGLLTAADVSPDGQFLVLLGYHDYVPFVWVWPGIGGGLDFSRAVRIDYPHYRNLQTEGLAILSNDSILISNEQSRGYPASVQRIDISSLFQD